MKLIDTLTAITAITNTERMTEIRGSGMYTIYIENELAVKNNQIQQRLNPKSYIIRGVVR